MSSDCFTTAGAFRLGILGAWTILLPGLDEDDGTAAVGELPMPNLINICMNQTDVSDWQSISLVNTVSHHTDSQNLLVYSIL